MQLYRDAGLIGVKRFVTGLRIEKLSTTILGPALAIGLWLRFRALGVFELTPARLTGVSEWGDRYLELPSRFQDRSQRFSKGTSSHRSAGSSHNRPFHNAARAAAPVQAF